MHPKDRWPDFCEACGSKKLEHCMRGASSECKRDKEMTHGCKGLEVAHGVWSGCVAKGPGLGDCPSCGELPKPSNPFRADAPLSAPTDSGLVPYSKDNPLVKDANADFAKRVQEQSPLAQLTGLPTDAKARKSIPVYSGVIKYFPDALAAVAELSRIGNDQHNPGQPLHWDKTKSLDHLDALTRHLLEAGTIDSDGVRHSAKIAWRALANLQTEIDKGL